MHKAILSLAATAALQLVTPAQAAITTTNYSITGTVGSGNFSLDFNDATSVYALSDLDFFVGTTFDASNAGIESFGSDLLIGGTVAGVSLQAGNANDFTFIFDPTAATQMAILFGFSLEGFPGTGSTSLTVTQTGTNGTITDYSISGGPASGTFSLDFNNITSVYSISALNFVVGATYDMSNGGIESFGSELLLGGTFAGVSIQAGNANDFSIIFDPTVATQTVGPGVGFGFSLIGFPDTGSNELTITQIAAPPPGVPEPSTWAMMLLGFGAAGLAMRRRKRVMPSLLRTA